MKAQASVLQGTVLIMMDPIILGCVVGRLLTIKALNLASRFFSINGNADLLLKETSFLGYRGEFSMPASIILTGNWCEWKTKKGGD